MDPDEIDIELRDVDREIIGMLEDGRCTRQHLAETLGYTGEYVYQRVTRLMEHGIVEKIHDGFYELAADGGVAGQPAPPTPADPDADVALSDGLPQSVGRVEARGAVAAALAELNGGISKAELVRRVMPEHPLGYDVEAAIEQVEAEGGRYRGAWWRRVIKPGLEANGAQYKNGVGWIV